MDNEKECSITLINLFMAYSGVENFSTDHIINEMSNAKTCIGIKGRDNKYLHEMIDKADEIKGDISTGCNKHRSLGRGGYTISPVMYNSLTLWERLCNSSLNFDYSKGSSFSTYLRLSFYSKLSAIGFPVTNYITHNAFHQIGWSDNSK